jgi:iron(III) transport system ATP-binding protein
VKPEYLTLEHIAKCFDDGNGGSVPAVRAVSLSIVKGEFVTILGPSGCGKTTTLRIVAGFETPDSGNVLLEGVNLNGVPAQERNMPLVFQSYALFPHLNVFDNIAYGLQLRDIPKEVIRNDVEMSLQLVNMAGLEKRFPRTLSGGQQQRVALARALVLKPSIILFDEPLSDLDAKLRNQMRSEIKRIQQMLGITALYVTHDQAEALSISDRVVVMNRGLIEQVGTPEEIYANPNSLFVADFVGNANFVEAVVEEITDAVIVANFQGRSVEIPRENCVDEVHEDEEVYLAIKPEAVHLTRGNSTFTGKLAGRFFLGRTVEYNIEFENTFLTAILSNEEPIPAEWSIGSTVHLGFNKNHFRVFRK